MESILLLDKPEGWTSHQLVLKVRKRFRQLGTPLKVGHTGTLDKLATGLMILTLGRATKATAQFQGLDKTYVCTARLGVATDTYDRYGKVTEEREVHVGADEVEEVFRTFQGTYLQLPPPYSAKKFGKKKAYQLAKAGREVPLRPKEITVYALEVREIHLPYVTFWLHCSSGTYVRRIVHDAGEKLAVGAHVYSLRRLTIGPFSLEGAGKTADLAQWELKDFQPFLIPLATALEKLEK